MDKKQYTPTKASKILSTITNTQATSNNKLAIDFTQRSNLNQDANIGKEYENLKQQVKQLQYQNRQLSTEAERLKYQKNIHQNKYMQKLSYEEETISQFQKEKNYQLELIKIKCEEESNRIRREFQIKIDQLQRELKAKDYKNREFNQKNSYVELKTNQLRKGVETLQGELLKYRQNSSNLNNLMSQQEFAKKKLQMATNQLQMQKQEMETQIHILLDIEAEKSRKMNHLQVQLRNSESRERALHQKLNSLTQHFSNLEEHIMSVKERLFSADTKNQQSEKHLQYAVQILGAKQEAVITFKSQQTQLREQLQRQQRCQSRRQRQLEELIIENQRLHRQLNANKHKLHEICTLNQIDF